MLSTGPSKFKSAEIFDLLIYFLQYRLSYNLLILFPAGMYTGKITKMRTRHPKKGCAWTLALGKFVKKGTGRALNSTTDLL